MDIHIRKLVNGTYWVNGKGLFKDSDGNWISGHKDFTETEQKFFLNHINAIDQGLIPEVTKVTYTL